MQNHRIRMLLARSATASSVVVTQSTYRKPRIDPLRELAPITQVLVVPQMIGSHPSLPAKNVKELIAFVKARPGKVDYSAGNYGGHPHLTMVLFMTMAGLDATFVPYKSGNDGAEPQGSKSPDDFSTFVRNEVTKWTKVVKDAGIRQQ